nr:ATP-binding cassette sub-family C member 5-like [Cherax quadricarinatus]
MRMSTLGSRNVGEVINLFANDAQRVYDLVVVGPLIVGGPIVAVGGVIYILWLLGPWALFGMIAFLLFYPFQFGISRLISYFRGKTVAVTDERISMVSELLNCIKLIKMYAWEKSFAAKITKIRSCERRLLEKSAYVQSVSVAMAPTVPIIAAIITFLAHIAAGYNLTAPQTYSLLMVFNTVIRNGFSYSAYAVVLEHGRTSLMRCQVRHEPLSCVVGLDMNLSCIFELDINLSCALLS